MRKGAQLLMAALFAVGVAACDRSADNRAGTQGAAGTSGSESSLGMGERNFVQDQLKDVTREVELGRLAQQQATSPDVRQFGSMMVEDHTRAGNQLREVAQRANVEIEHDTEAARDDREKLSKLSGAEFDREYIDMMVKDHQDAVDALKGKAEDAENPGVKQWASATLPRVQHHLELAQQLQERLKSETGNSASRPQGQ